MLLTVENTARVGKGMRIYDANGLEWTKVIEADTETGRILRFKTDAEGRLMCNERRDEVLREEIVVAAPLVAVPVKRKDA